MNKVAKVTWVSIGILAAIIVITMILTRGGQ
jgi:uncharacterized membrane protein